MDLNDLVKAFEEKFGVSAAAVAAGPAAAAVRLQLLKNKQNST
jgi:ribosomal protein L7/L12